MKDDDTVKHTDQGSVKECMWVGVSVSTVMVHGGVCGGVSAAVCGLPVHANTIHGHGQVCCEFFQGFMQQGGGVAFSRVAQSRNCASIHPWTRCMYPAQC